LLKFKKYSFFPWQVNIILHGMWKKEKALICVINSILAYYMDRIHPGNREHPGKERAPEACSSGAFSRIK